MNKKRLQKYAKLAVQIGVNVQKDQMVVVNSPVECKELARLIVEEAYLAGAKYVYVNWSDDEVRKLYFTHAAEEILEWVPEYLIKQYQMLVDEKVAVISISAPTPGLLKDVDPKKMQKSTIASHKKLGFYQKHMMANGSQWSIVAAPTYAWAKKVFPNAEYFEVVDQLWEAILKASRVLEDNDPIQEWKDHMATLAANNKRLNDYQFTSLCFKNAVGTNLEVGLVENHIWAGGGEVSQNGVYFAPNIPTEETFTMPHKDKTNGKVVATKPLNYQGNLVEEFYLVFKDGEVVEYGATSGLDTLKSLLELDEGSKRIGEVALISHQSPISNMNILFYNTLFDENASCHLALGNAYAMNIKNGTTLAEEELLKLGYNKSITHVDFMFGSSDMQITGVLKDGKEVIVFKDGNFVF